MSEGDQPKTDEKQVLCAMGYILRQREWSERGEECLGTECPHPTICTTRHRDLLKARGHD